MLGCLGSCRLLHSLLHTLSNVKACYLSSDASEEIKPWRLPKSATGGIIPPTWIYWSRFCYQAAVFMEASITCLVRFDHAAIFWFFYCFFPVASLSLMLAVTVPRIIQRAGFTELFFRSVSFLQLSWLGHLVIKCHKHCLWQIRAFQQKIAQEKVAWHSNPKRNMINCSWAESDSHRFHDPPK